MAPGAQPCATARAALTSQTSVSAPNRASTTSALAQTCTLSRTAMLECRCCRCISRHVQRMQLCMSSESVRSLLHIDNNLQGTLLDLFRCSAQREPLQCLQNSILMLATSYHLTVIKILHTVNCTAGTLCMQTAQAGHLSCSWHALTAGLVRFSLACLLKVCSSAFSSVPLRTPAPLRPDTTPLRLSSRTQDAESTCDRLCQRLCHCNDQRDER